MAHNYLTMAISEGDIAVDATAGNGRDTLFLATKVGPAGQVFAFDIQEEALITTRELLSKKGLLKRVTLVSDNHENLRDYVKRPVSAFIYNLGYLPGGDHELTTEPASVLNSLREALLLVKPGGIISMVFYPGHDQGKLEKNAILPFCRKLPSSYFAVLYSRIINQEHDPPELMVIQKNHFPAEGKFEKDICYFLSNKT